MAWTWTDRELERTVLNALETYVEESGGAVPEAVLPVEEWGWVR